jgi:hypothetical protein
VEVLVHGLAGVFLQVGAGQVELEQFAIDEELDHPALHDGNLVLADLVTLGQVGIEIVLAGEDLPPLVIARSTAPRFITGSEPGSARSTAQACVFGSAPKRVEAPEKIFDWVESWAWVSKPITTS